jgi:two-component system, chemotaxis family, protein-glutamate methylesterase/glutaminase
VARTKVLVVDDSALMRQLLSELLREDGSLEVVGSAADPIAAIDKIRSLKPDVLTLDVEMPRMDGLTFLEKLMRNHPLPVVMVSSLTESGCATTLRALELGAVDFVTKPKLDVEAGTRAVGRELVEKVRTAAQAKLRSRPRDGAPKPAAAPPRSSVGIDLTHKLIAIGASTGGTEALRDVLAALPADAPGVVVVQHMPEKFTRSFAERLDSLCRIKVVEARDGERVLPGHAFIAPGNLHMKVVRNGAETRVRVGMAAPVNHHRPSVDVLFGSCARHLGANAIGVILTGMGSDGARGMLAMREAGARTVAQDEASCVVYGMPKEAVELGAVEEIRPLAEIPNAVLRLLSERSIAR